MADEMINTLTEKKHYILEKGQDYVMLTREPIKVDHACTQVTMSSTGAIALFVGTTRDTFENKKVIKLEYEAYEAMALKELIKICFVVREKLKLGKICILHRLGEVATKEASVIIAVSSVHRKDSLDAVQIIIDTLKATVPIWKKEVYDEGLPEWKSNTECSWMNIK